VEHGLRDVRGLLLIESSLGPGLRDSLHLDRYGKHGMQSSAYSFEFLLKLGVALALLPSVMANSTANRTCSSRSIVPDNLHESLPLGPI